jgi:predicted metal-dependent phosphoesterase TrpH
MATETKAAMSANTTAATIPQLAAERLHVEIIPGTEVMTDIGNSHLAKAGGNGSVYVDHHRIIRCCRSTH